MDWLHSSLLWLRFDSRFAVTLYINWKIPFWFTIKMHFSAEVWTSLHWLEIWGAVIFSVEINMMMGLCSFSGAVQVNQKMMGVILSHDLYASRGAWRPRRLWSPETWCVKSARCLTPTIVTMSSASVSCSSVFMGMPVRTALSNGRWKYASCHVSLSMAYASNVSPAPPSPSRTSHPKLPMSWSCDRHTERFCQKWNNGSLLHWCLRSQLVWAPFWVYCFLKLLLYVLTSGFKKIKLKGKMSIFGIPSSTYTQG